MQSNRTSLKFTITNVTIFCLFYIFKTNVCGAFGLYYYYIIMLDMLFCPSCFEFECFSKNVTCLLINY